MSSNRTNARAADGDRVTPKDGVFPHGTAERVLDHFRTTNDAVDALFHVHVGNRDRRTLDLESIEDAVAHLNYAVVLVLGHEEGDEHLYCRERDDGTPEWFSITDYVGGRTIGPIALYRCDVPPRLEDFPVSVERTDRSLFAGRELPPHGLNADTDGVRTDA